MSGSETSDERRLAGLPATHVLIHLAGEVFSVAAHTWSAPGKGHDRSLMVDGFVGVADGATPLGGQRVDPGEFAGRALDALRRAGRSPDAPQDVWRGAITSLRPAVLEHPPVSCSVVAVRERGTDLEFGRLGDCSAVVTRTDGGLLRLSDVTIAALDRVARESDEPTAVYRRHRELMNTSEGYWILADEPAAADHVDVLTVPVGQVAGFVLFSDGATALMARGEPVTDDSTLVVARRQVH